MLLVAAIGCRSSSAPRPQPLPDRVPRNAWRFAIAGTSDSTVRFQAGDAKWLRSGMTGYAVDPAKKDAFVARLSLLTDANGDYSALVTGLLRPIDSTHVIVMIPPATPWWRTKQFWGGLLSGAAVATGTILIAR